MKPFRPPTERSVSARDPRRVNALLLCGFFFQVRQSQVSASNRPFFFFFLSPLSSLKGTLTRARTELNPEYLDLRPRAELNPEYWTPCTPLVSTNVSFTSHQNNTPSLPLSPNYGVRQFCFRDLNASSAVICCPPLSPLPLCCSGMLCLLLTLTYYPHKHH